MMDVIAEKAEIKLSPMIHIECPACGAETIKDLIRDKYADKIFIKCPYCKTEVLVRIDWREWSET
jgi:uncharacterized Zn finger protein